MTRPSEAEVTEIVAAESAHWRERIAESACSAEARDAALVAHDRFVSRLTAALSTTAQLVRAALETPP